MKQKNKIGVIGVGMVGEQVRRWFTGKGYSVLAYDKYKKIGRMEDLFGADIIFLCLPSPYDEKIKTGVDTSLFKQVIKYFKLPKIFIIKSTVPPGTTDALQKFFPKHNFFHSPEFLTEATAWTDFSKPVHQLLGYTKGNKKLAEDIINILPKGSITTVLEARVTEIFKYARNAFFAVKVIFANQIYDICRSFGADYDEIKKLMYHDPWIGGNHLDALHKGYRGFGGKCLPKDLKTLIKVFKSRRLKPELFETVDRINLGLLAKQKMIRDLNRYWLNNANS